MWHHPQSRKQGGISMRFIKIVTGKCCERQYVNQHDGIEIGIDIDKIVEVKHYTNFPERLSDLNPRKYMSEIKIVCDGIEKSLEIPAPLDLVLAYLNGDVDLDAIKNYEIPTPEAPEDLNEWVKILENDNEIKAINKIINRGVTTKSQLLQMTARDIKALHGCGGSSKTCGYVIDAMKVFGLV